MFFRQIFDPDLAQYAYLIGCQQTGEAIVIDPERDVDRYIDIAAEDELRIVAAAETHIHADFLSGARELAEKEGVKLYLSDGGDEDWKYTWADPNAYDVVLLQDGDTFQIGNIRFETVHSPGHTPEHISFLVTDLGGGATDPIGIASGDFVFVGDVGRPDLLESAAGVVGAREPSAIRLYDSTRRFLTLADHVQVWPGHGAGSACGKALGAVPQSTVGYERRFNTALSFEEQDDFVRAILEGQPEPPLYFARMKKLNRDGVPVLGRLPSPESVSADELLDAARRGAAVIDTRADRTAFMGAHLPGSIYAPLGVAFAMVIGSYVDPDQDIHLIVEQEELDRAIRILARIGYDRVVGHAPPGVLAELETAATIERVDFPNFKPEYEPSTVLDVRGAAEFAERRIPSALNVAHTRLGTRLDEIPKDQPVYVYCRTGSRASSAASYLAAKGYDVTFVDGLFAEWPGRTEAGAAEQPTVSV